jgi:hypothetical protein
MFTRNFESRPEAATIGNSASSFVCTPSADFVRFAMVVTGSDTVRISAGSYAGVCSVLSGGHG